MTIDDEKSIYVGGIPYDCTESQLRRVFDLYGSVVAVKIVNDRGVGGKCYGFITFKNPRSATEAISEMDGRTIGGRVVRVNEVKTRGADERSNYGRESLRRNQRDIDGDKRRSRERENDYDKDRQRINPQEHDGRWERKYDHTRDREHSRVLNHCRDFEHSRDLDHSRDHLQGKERDENRDLMQWEGERERAHGRNRDRELERDDSLNYTQDRELDRGDDHDRRIGKNRDHHTKRKHSFSSSERQSREFSSESSDYHDQVEEQLDLLIKRREELQKEKSDMEQRLEEKKLLIADLHKRSLILEDSLTSAKKYSSLRQMQLTKLRKCFLQVKECGERLKSSEDELQDLVYSVSMEIDAGGDLGAKDAYLTNGEC
ncbi:hypothetical protein BVRB_8g195440 isoform A [Beta vulgaris subsp. vulgaris]|nr:hypothetical protein BVRB_8g195440 isoform A [Beta vulgaris subsp. vulgaris]